MESIQEMNVGLGSKLILAHGAADHKGFDNVYPTIVKGGQPVLLTDWSGAGQMKAKFADRERTSPRW